METKNLFKLFLGAALAVLAVVFAPAGLLLADSVAVDLPDAAVAQRLFAGQMDSPTAA